MRLPSLIFRYRLFAEIVFYHLRHEIVNAFVVRNAVARRVDDTHISASVGFHKIRDADKRFGIECQRVEIFVGDTAVKHAYPRLTARVSATFTPTIS